MTRRPPQASGAREEGGPCPGRDCEGKTHGRTRERGADRHTVTCSFWNAGSRTSAGQARPGSRWAHSGLCRTSGLPPQQEGGAGGCTGPPPTHTGASARGLCPDLHLGAGHGAGGSPVGRWDPASGIPRLHAGQRQAHLPPPRHPSPLQRVAAQRHRVESSLETRGFQRRCPSCPSQQPPLRKPQQPKHNPSQARDPRNAKPSSMRESNPTIRPPAGKIITK